MLTKLTAAHVETLLADLARDGVSAHVRRQVYAVLHRAMGCAVRWRLVPHNVVNATDKPRAPRRELRPLDATEAQALLDAAAGTRLEALYVLALSTGMRQGELLGLQWGDIDFDASALSVRRTLFELNGKMQTGEPKTAKGTRRIALPAFALTALRAHQEAMLAEGHRAAPVFCDTDGGWLRKSNLIRRSFHPLLKKAGLRRLRFHDLRHSAATLLLLSGIHPKVVQERLGHATISVTMDTYSHVLPTMQTEAAARLDGMFTQKAADRR